MLLKVLTIFLGQVISYTGYAPGFADLATYCNIPRIIFQGMVKITCGFYLVFVLLPG